MISLSSNETILATVFGLDCKIGWCASCFDLLHPGHVIYLQRSKERCDFLMVGLQTDPTIDRSFKNKPIQTLEERWIQLNAIKYVDQIVVYDTEERHREILRLINPTVVFKGDDHKGKKIIEDEGLFKFDFLPRTKWSTTELRSRIKMFG